MDRIILGDNQFFAVNHISDSKSIEQSIRFKDDQMIIRTLEIAFDEGINTFMCTSHDRIDSIMGIISKHDQLHALQIYPCMPYAHKYANSVTENGISGTIHKYLSGNLISSILKGGRALISRDYIAMMEMLIDVEMKLFKNVNTPIIFLQNVVTDLLLGLRMYDMFLYFDEYIKKKYSAQAGFITMNLPLLINVFKKIGLEHVVIAASINKTGFRMAGLSEDYKKILSNPNPSYEIMAMQIFAGGSIPARDAVAYITGQPAISSMVFGASSRQHIQDTVNWVSFYDNISAHGKMNSLT